MSVLMSVVAHTKGCLCICERVCTVHLLTVHTLTHTHTHSVSVKEDEVPAVHPGSWMVGFPQSRGLFQGETLVIKRRLLHGLFSLICPHPQVNLRCKSLCINGHSSTT